jgi:hypothetical protein
MAAVAPLSCRHAAAEPCRTSPPTQFATELARPTTPFALTVAPSGLSVSCLLVHRCTAPLLPHLARPVQSRVRKSCCASCWRLHASRSSGTSLLQASWWVLAARCIAHASKSRPVPGLQPGYPKLTSALRPIESASTGVRNTATHRAVMLAAVCCRLLCCCLRPTHTPCRLQWGEWLHQQLPT